MFCRFRGIHSSIVALMTTWRWVVLLLPGLSLFGDEYTEGEILFSLKVKPLLKQLSQFGGKVIPELIA